MSKKHTKHHHHHHSRRKKHKHFLFGTPPHGNVQHQVFHSAAETGKDLLIGVVGGGLVGAAIGKSSLLWGILVTGAGHYTNNRIVQLVGIGMMGANGFQNSMRGTNGLDGMDGIKERLTAYKDSFSQKFYLDKFLHKQQPVMQSGDPGMGEIQYFTYPDAMNGDLAALSDIESQLTQSAIQFQGGMSGNGMGASELPDSNVGDVEDNLY